MDQAQPHRVVIVGGGFGGLHAARSLNRAPVQVTLIDRRNFHLFQPLLYQVATGALSPANIAAPLRSILRRQKNTKVLLGEVQDLDPERREVVLSDGRVAYDSLILAAGATHSYFGRDDWELVAPGLKTVEDATTIRRRLLLAYEAAERETDPQKRQAWMTFVVVGAGPTGVELAGALSEVAQHTLRGDFRSIDTGEARILLVEAGEHPLSVYPPKLIERASHSLADLGVTLRTRTMVTDIQPGFVMLRSGDKTERVDAQTVLWAAGVQASPLGRILAERTGAPLDRAGRVIVEPDLSIPGHPAIFVVGDLAHYAHQTDRPLPGVAPVAMQEGKYVARLILARLEGRTIERFRYSDWGTMATIGRNSAVAVLGNWKLSGFFAWLIWLFVHLMQIVQFENRVLVFMQWTWNFVTRNRSARLITGDVESPLQTESTVTQGDREIDHAEAASRSTEIR